MNLVSLANHRFENLSSKKDVDSGDSFDFGDPHLIKSIVESRRADVFKCLGLELASMIFVGVCLIIGAFILGSSGLINEMFSSSVFGFFGLEMSIEVHKL